MMIFHMFMHNVNFQSVIKTIRNDALIIIAMSEKISDSSVTLSFFNVSVI